MRIMLTGLEGPMRQRPDPVAAGVGATLGSDRAAVARRGPIHQQRPWKSSHALQAFTIALLSIGLLSIAVCALPKNARATTEVAVVTQTQVVFLADSKVTKEAGGVRSSETGCKIHETNGAYWMTVGARGNNGRGSYSAWSDAEAALRASGSLSHRVGVFKRMLAAQVRRALLYAPDDEEYERYKLGKGVIVLAVFGELRNGVTSLYVVEILPVRRPDGKIGVRAVSSSLRPAAAKVTGYIRIFGEQSAILSKYSMAEIISKAGDGEFVQGLVQTEIDDDPKDVGGPIAQLLVDATGAHWISGAAPGEPCWLEARPER